MSQDTLDSVPGFVHPQRAPAWRPPALRPAYAPVDDGGAAEETPRQLRDYLRVLRKHNRLAAGCFAGTLALTGLVTLVTPRRYTASARLQVARQSPIQPRLADNVRRMDDTDAAGQATFVATQATALQSRDLAKRVLEQHGLTDGEAILLPAVDRGAPQDARPVDPKLIDRYMKYLTVTEVRGTDLIEVSFTTPRPDLSAFLAAAHTQAYMDANDEARQATDTVADSFLDRQLADSRAQMERAGAALDAFAGEHPNVAVNQEQEVVAHRITELSSLLTKAEAARTTLETRYAFLTGRSTDRLSYFLDRPGVEKLRLALLDVLAQQAALKSRLGPKHPQMHELTQLKTELMAQLKAEVEQGVQAVRSQYDAARLRADGLRASLARQEKTGIELRALGARYDLLKKDVETTRELHGSLLKQRMETKVNSALVPTNVRVIERAEVPHRPSRPKIPLNLALGGFSGLVIAIGAAFAREYLDGSLKSSEEVEGLLQVPALAAIPNFALARRAADHPNGHAIASFDHHSEELLVLREPWSRVAEAFRSMRTLLFASAGSPKVIVVTSARPGEGKTVASLNLAGALAELGSRTLLIDADLRHPRCHAALGIDDQFGLSSWLAGQVHFQVVIRTLDVPNLFFIPAGPPPKSPASLLSSERMQRALMLLRQRFDFIVIDTPPILPVTDAAVLAREADGVLLVVKGHETEAEAVRCARDRLVLAGANLLGVVMNNVGLGWGDPYFYETYYSHGGPRPSEGGRA